jgi:LysM repeat protein
METRKAVIGMRTILGIAALMALPGMVEAQSLRGSRASVELMYASATSSRLAFYQSAATIARAVEAGTLVPLSSNRHVELHPGVSHPYVLPATRSFVNAIAARYYDACGERLMVTSATRTTERQPRNASPKSVHPTGMAVDFRRPAGKCLEWLRAELVKMEKAGQVEATEERSPPHFHVAVLRRRGSTVMVAEAPAPSAAAAPAAAVTPVVAPAAVTAEEPRAVRTAANAGAANAGAAKASARATPVKYTVRSGDTLSEIAKRHGTTTARLRQLNRLPSTKIRAGQRLVVR